MSNKLKDLTIPVPTSEAEAPPQAEAPPHKLPEPREGEGGKGALPAAAAMSKAQRQVAFQKDTGALVTALQGLGAVVRSRASKNGVFVWYVYARLATLRKARDAQQLPEDKAIARAALAAFESIATFRGDWVSATFYRDSAYFGTRREAGEHHPK